MRVMLLTVLLAATACGASDTTFAAPDERFVATMVELRRAAMMAGTDTAAFEELRLEVLRERGVTEDELRAYVEANSADLDHMAMIWDSVAARLEEQPVE
jgi:hypothetical protein